MGGVVKSYARLLDQLGFGPESADPSVFVAKVATCASGAAAWRSRSPALPKCILIAICRKGMHSCLPRSSDTQLLQKSRVNSVRISKKSRIARAWEAQVHTFAINSDQNAPGNSLEQPLLRPKLSLLRLTLELFTTFPKSDRYLQHFLQLLSKNVANCVRFSKKS